MGWDGSGNFSRARNWQNDEAADIDMLSANFDEEDDNFATGINACLTKNNETKPTADFRPNATRTYALGSTALRWTNAYLSGSVNVQSATAAAATTIAFTDATSARTITIPDATGTIGLIDAAETVSGDKTFSGDNTHSGLESFALTKFSTPLGPRYLNNISIDATVASNALTVTLYGNDGAAPSATNPVQLSFRSSTLTTGTTTVATATAATTVVAPDGATLGFIASEDSYIYVYALNNAGTVELALSGSPHWDTNILQSTTAIGTGSDTRTVLYSTTLRSNVAIRFIGLIKIQTGATPGQWGSAASIKATATDVPPVLSIGYCQTWQDMTGSRSLSTSYTNSTGRPIEVSVYSNTATGSGISGSLTLTIGGVTVSYGVMPLNASLPSTVTVAGIVPPGVAYSVAGSNMSIGGWSELR